jgi:protein TonB
MPDRNKTLAVITVAGLHGMALYGLVTGLGVDYVKDQIAVLAGHNIPADPPPPSLPEPEPTRADEAATMNTRQTAVPQPIDAARNPYAARDKTIVLLPTAPNTSVAIDTTGPLALPTPDKPVLTPRAVRPRNNPGSWVSTEDYPSASLRRGEQGTVRFEVAVAADGRVSDCRVTASSGSADLDAATCRYVSHRARFEPATDGTGARVAGTYMGSIRWVIPQD